MYILTAGQSRAADEYTINTLGIPGITLMGRAAARVHDEICARGLDAGDVCIVCGSGNNGGDGLALAGLLNRARVTVVLSSPRSLSPDAQHFFDALGSGVRTVPVSDAAACREAVEGAQLIVDAMYGTGFRGALPDTCAALADYMNKARGAVCAIDIPSGCLCDTGSIEGASVNADFTVTFTSKKPCHYLYPAAGCCGAVTVADIGIPTEAVTRAEPDIIEADAEYAAGLLPLRAANSHKGTFGRLCLLCGSDDMTGAARLATKAALRSGVGLADLASTRAVIDAAAASIDEAVFTTLYAEEGRVAPACLPVLSRSLSAAQAVVIGCGLGTGEGVAAVVEGALKENIPAVLDADGITAVAGNIDIPEGRRAPLVLTPHPKELARLMHMEPSGVSADRIGTARQAACRYGATVVSKGANTVICAPDGRVFINPCANSGLAKGGSGDVLSGVIGAFLAQGLSGVDSAVLGVYIHSAAGALAASQWGEFSMKPGDLAGFFPAVFSELQKTVV